MEAAEIDAANMFVPTHTCWIFTNSARAVPVSQVYYGVRDTHVLAIPDQASSAAVQLRCASIRFHGAMLVLAA